MPALVPILRTLFQRLAIALLVFLDQEFQADVANLK